MVDTVRGQQALLLADDATRAEAFVFADDDIADPLRDALATVARIALDATQGGVDLLPRRHESAIPDALSLRNAAASVETRPSASRTRAAPADASLAFDNGIGGFATCAREYVIRLRDDVCTPAPWINVLANASFGCFVSAEGGA